MPLSEEEKKERKRISQKKYYEKNKEKLIEYQKEYREENIEKYNEYCLEYYHNNKEKNKEKIKESKRKYSKTEKGKKTNRISVWKKSGVICIDYDEMYNIYINTSKCNYCNKEFENSKDSHLDHNHDTGQVRGILCRDCNTKDVLKDS